MIAKRKPFRSKSYLAFVRSLPCAMCATTQGVAAHHLIGMWHTGGMGMKAPDSMAMPLCDGPGGCHAMVHAHKHLRQMQPDWMRETLRKGLEQFSGETREQLTHALAFVEAKEGEPA